MNTKLSHFLIVALIALLGLTACQSTSFTPYPDVGSRIERAEVLQGVWAQLPGVPVEGLDDSTYGVISADWLLENINNYRAWAWEFLPDYQGEALDCDNFGRILREVVNTQAGKADIPASPLVAAVYVEQRVRWANVPGSDSARHVVNGVVTDRGIFIIEPQSLTTREPTWSRLKHYPNRIYKVQF